jgi:hypothetical protein
VAGGRAEDGAADRVDLGRPARLAVLLHRRPEVGREAFDPLDHRVRVERDAFGLSGRRNLADTALEPGAPGVVFDDAAERRAAQRGRERAIGASIASFRQRTSASLAPIETVSPASSSSARMLSARGPGES